VRDMFRRLIEKIRRIIIRLDIEKDLKEEE